MSASITVRLSTDGLPRSGALLVPSGIITALGSVAQVTATGGTLLAQTLEQSTGQAAMILRPDAAEIALHYQLQGIDLRGALPRYPDIAFQPRPCPLTQAADDLAHASVKFAREAGGGRDAVRALVAEASARFTYDHPDEKFNDGFNEVPYLGCSVATGSCVDINTYLVASLRSAGIEAAYVYGYFFPEERQGYTVGMHCWVVTRVNGQLEEWDIAHHKKMGTDVIGEGLNPKPGCRAVIGHSMSHRYATPFGLIQTKLLASPIWIDQDGSCRPLKIDGAWLSGDLQQAA